MYNTKINSINEKSKEEEKDENDCLLWKGEERFESEDEDEGVEKKESCKEKSTSVSKSINKIFLLEKDFKPIKTKKILMKSFSFSEQNQTINNLKEKKIVFSIYNETEVKKKKSTKSLKYLDKRNINSGRWTTREHFKFIKGILLYGNNWKKVNNLLFLFLD